MVHTTRWDSIEEQEKYRIEKWKVNGKLEAQKTEVVEWMIWKILVSRDEWVWAR
jgi:hypothetical protein